MERQVIADTELRVKLHHQYETKESGSDFPTLSNHLNYNQAKFESDAGNLMWTTSTGMEQSCNYLLCAITLER